MLVVQAKLHGNLLGNLQLPIYCRHGDHRLKFSEQECEADVDLELEIKSRKRRCYFSLTQYRHRFVDGATVAAIQI